MCALPLRSTGAAAGPAPVYAPDRSVADPGCSGSTGTFHVYSTDGKGEVSRDDAASGPWRRVGPADDISDPPPQVDTSKALWAPGAWHLSGPDSSCNPSSLRMVAQVVWRREEIAAEHCVATTS